MSQCDKLQESFSSYIEGELPVDERRNLENHFSLCTNCREVLNRMRLVRQNLSQLTPITASPDFDVKLNQKLRSLSAQPASRKFSTDYLMNWRFATAVIVVFVIAVSSFMLMDPTPENVNLDNLNESSFTPTISGQNDHRSQEENVLQSGNNTTLVNQDSTAAQQKKDALKDQIQQVNDR